MDPEKTALDLIPTLYDAAVHVERMQWFVDGVTEALRGYHVGLLLRLPGGDEPPLMYCGGSDPAVAAPYAEYYHALDPTLPIVVSAGVGEIVEPESEVPRERLLGTEYYEDWLRPSGFAWGPGYVAALEVQKGRSVSSFAMSRLRGARRFGAAGRRLMELLVPHLISARRVWGTLEQASARERGLADALDRMAMGVLVVDARRRLLWASRAADEILARRDGLYLERGELRAQARRASVALQRLIGQAVRTGAGAGLGAGGALTLPRPSGKRALEAMVTPIPRETSLGALELPGVAVVFVTDPAAAPPDAEDLLRALYSLTPAEARLAKLLAADLSLREVSERLGITFETARQRLKQVFDKTGTRRQASLIRLLLCGPASLAARPLRAESLRAENT